MRTTMRFSYKCADNTKHCPRQTSPEIAEKVVLLRKKTGYGRKRLSRLLWSEFGIKLSPHTIRHILRRYGLSKEKRKRNPCYPGNCAWQQDEKVAFLPAQVDVKEICDQGTLGRGWMRPSRRYKSS